MSPIIVVFVALGLGTYAKGHDQKLMLSIENSNQIVEALSCQSVEKRLAADQQRCLRL